MSAAEFGDQLALDVPGVGRLEVDPTPAMRRGEQTVWQHSWCGTVVVRSSLEQRGPLGPCPSCSRPDAEWWSQPVLVAGLRRAEAL